MSSWSMSICSLMVPDSSSAKNILRPSLHIGEGRDLWGQYALLLLAFEQSFGDGVGDALHHLDQYDHDDHGRPGDGLVELLVAVGDGEVTETATADVAGHGRHVEHANEQEGVSPKEILS